MVTAIISIHEGFFFCRFFSMILSFLSFVKLSRMDTQRGVEKMMTSH